MKKLLLVAGLVMGLSSIAQADDLVIYSGRSDKFVKPVVEAFSQETGIKVVLHSGKSTALINKLKLEDSKTTADLFISNDAGNLQTGSEMGLFAQLPARSVEVIPANLRAADNSWVGVSARARVLVVNKNDHSADFVKSVFDLADARLKGKLAITHSTNESYIAGITVYTEAAGEKKVSEWLKGMKENAEGKVYNKHGKIVSDVADGKKTIGLVNHYYIYRHLEKHPDAPIKIVLPDQDGMGVAWNVAGVAVSKFSKNRAAAEKFVDFLVSEKGQEIFAKTNREYPTRQGVNASAEVPRAGSYKVANVPMALLGSKRNATLDLIESVGMP